MRKIRITLQSSGLNESSAHGWSMQMGGGRPTIEALQAHWTFSLPRKILDELVTVDERHHLL